MARSLRSYEGEMLIDNTAAGEGKFESATYTCSHCNRVERIDPLRRTPAPYCGSCDRYICTQPRCNNGCTSMKRWIDEAREEFAKKGRF